MSNYKEISRNLLNMEWSELLEVASEMDYEVYLNLHPLARERVDKALMVVALEHAKDKNR